MPTKPHHAFRIADDDDFEALPIPISALESPKARELRAQIDTLAGEIATLDSEAPPSTKARLEGRLGGLTKALRREQARTRGVQLAELTAMTTELFQGAGMADGDLQSAVPSAWEAIQVDAREYESQHGRPLTGTTLRLLMSAALTMAASNVAYAKGHHADGAKFAETASKLLKCYHDIAAPAEGTTALIATGDRTPETARQLMQSLFRTAAAGDEFTPSPSNTREPVTEPSSWHDEAPELANWTPPSPSTTAAQAFERREKRHASLPYGLRHYSWDYEDNPQQNQFESLCDVLHETDRKLGKHQVTNLAKLLMSPAPWLWVGAQQHSNPARRRELRTALESAQDHPTRAAVLAEIRREFPSI